MKKSKINILVKAFEMFSMKTHDAINAFFNRFKGITYELQALGKDVCDVEMNDKVMRSLPIHPLWMVHDINTLKF